MFNVPFSTQTAQLSQDGTPSRSMLLHLFTRFLPSTFARRDGRPTAATVDSMSLLLLSFIVIVIVVVVTDPRVIDDSPVEDSSLTSHVTYALFT